VWIQNQKQRRKKRKKEKLPGRTTLKILQTVILNHQFIGMAIHGWSGEDLKLEVET